VTIEGNGARGKVVLENTLAADTNLPTTCEVVSGACFPSDHPKYSEWVTLGEPNEWCYPNFCYGDADNASEPYGRGTVAIGYDDLDILLGNWLTQSPLADFDMASEPYGRGTVRVGYEDLDVLLGHWLQTPAGDCLTNY
jgi:hypothetical protein